MNEPTHALPHAPNAAADNGAPDGQRFEHFFRDADAVPEHPLASALQQRQDLIDALRGLFSGAQAGVQLRLWCFMELASQPQARLSRDDVNRLFHMLWPEALDGALKRLRELGLLVWDATPQDYHLSPLAQQVHALLASLTTPIASAEEDEMSGLLAQVAGAQQLGVLEQVAREAYSEPEVVRSSPHRSTVHQIDAGALDDPERWALTWRARQRKQAASAVEPGVTSG